MSFKEIKELRQAGQLEEALQMAHHDLEKEPSNIWNKRSIAWVYYDYLKLYANKCNFEAFIEILERLLLLELPTDEVMIYDQISWNIGKLCFNMQKQKITDNNKYYKLLKSILSLYFIKPSESFSFLFKALHKALKDTDYYVEFADWWDFNNFNSQDYLKDKLPNNKEVMSIAEQAFIAYSKRLLEGKLIKNDLIIQKEKYPAEKLEQWLIQLSELIEKHPEYQFLSYYKAKILIELGDKENIWDSFLPFAKQKRSEFWVWDLISELVDDNEEANFACLCKALLCYGSPEFLIKIREKFTKLLISKQFYREAATEITEIINQRTINEWRIPSQITSWQSEDWYKSNQPFNDNKQLYLKYESIAEELLFQDVPEVKVIVEFVNNDKRILNYINEENNVGFFKFDRFFRNINIGDVLIIRMQSVTTEGKSQVYTAKKIPDVEFQSKFIRDFNGKIKINPGNSFGFVEDIYISKILIAQFQLKHLDSIKGTAMKSYNSDKNQWGWKVIKLTKLS